MNGHENDANGAGSAGSVSGDNGGIFSTPDLTIESQNIPANVGGTPVVDETANNNSARIASAFASTDASQNPQFRSNVTSSTVTSDIKLAPATKPKSKALSIIIIVLILAAVGGLVWAVTSGKISFGNSSEETGEKVTIFDVQKTYDRYAAYVLFGESKDKLEGEWRSNDTYKVHEEVFSDTVDQEYWSTAIDLVKQSIEKFEESGDGRSSLLNDMKFQETYLIFFRMLQENTMFSSDAMLEYYFQNGYNDTVKHFNSIRNYLIGIENTSLSSQARIINDILNVTQDILDQLSNTECTLETFSDGSCTAGLSDGDYDTFYDRTMLILNLEEELFVDVQASITKMTSVCWDISWWIISDYDSVMMEDGEE